MTPVPTPDSDPVPGPVSTTATRAREEGPVVEGPVSPPAAVPVATLKTEMSVAWGAVRTAPPRTCSCVPVVG